MVSSATDSARLYSPIVKIKSLPASLKSGNGTDDKYHPIELEDMASLAKLSFGFEEKTLVVLSLTHKLV